MPVFFIHDPAQGRITPLDKKYHIRDIPPTSELSETNAVHEKVTPPEPPKAQARSAINEYEQQSEKDQTTQGKVVDFMNHPVMSILESKSLKDAWDMMEKYEIHHLAIVNENGELTGMLRESLILKYRMDNEETKAHQTPLTSFCTGPVLSTNSAASIDELAVGLLELGLSGVPVTDNGIVTGMITRSDVLKIFLRGQSVKAEV